MGLRDLLRPGRSRKALEAPLPVAALPQGGRSSRESRHTLLAGIASYLAYWNGVEPLLPPGYLEQIVRMAVVNPDMSQAVSNWVAIGNPGHDLIIIGDDDSVLAAEKRLNAKARSLAPHAAGIDGLVNKYLEQVALTGAISSEDVVALEARPGVEQVVIVPASQIRFKREGGQYVPYQLADGEELPLNPITYRYLAHMTIENSPYAKPPMVAAIEPILDQRTMKENMQFVLKKFGLFGLISAAVAPPHRELRETDDEYHKRVQGYLKEVLEAFKQNFHEGLAVYTDDIKVERTNLTTDARGVQEIFRLNEEQVFSGLGTDPAMHGRTYSTTETYAQVVYDLLVRHAESYQRPVKRRIERTYRLDLALAGIPVEDVSLHFHEARSRDPLTEARARQVEWRVAREKVAAGLLDPDSAARELGYDDWYDMARIPFSDSVRLQLADSSPPSRPLGERHHRFRFESFTQRYRYLRPRLAVLTATPVPKTASHAGNGDMEPLPDAVVEGCLTD
ncbi:MAG: hypothetical protein JSU77_08760 [Fidelibacterota bacterium]|nr:MAG: hypothetical protein JSU77_08760 [Candidatus Neomarinimicrobiota bacterium]